MLLCALFLSIEDNILSIFQPTTTARNTKKARVLGTDILFLNDSYHFFFTTFFFHPTPLIQKGDPHCLNPLFSFFNQSKLSHATTHYPSLPLHASHVFFSLSSISIRKSTYKRIWLSNISNSGSFHQELSDNNSDVCNPSSTSTLGATSF